MFCLAGQIADNAAKQHQQTRLVCSTTKAFDWLHFFWLDAAVRDGSFLLHFLPNKNTLEAGCTIIFFPQRQQKTKKKPQQENLTLNPAAGAEACDAVWEIWSEFCSEPRVKLQAAVTHAFLSLYRIPLLRLSLVLFSSSSELHEHRGTGHQGLSFQRGDNLAVNLQILGQYSEKKKKTL